MSAENVSRRDPLSRVGWFLFFTAAAATAGAALMLPRGVRGLAPVWPGFLWMGAFVAFATVGAFIIAGKPRHPIGWFFCLVGCVMQFVAFAFAYAAHSVFVTDEPLPLTHAAASFQAWAFPLVIGSIPLILLLFPDGRPPSPRWRVVAWVLAVATIGLAIASAVESATRSARALLLDAQAPGDDTVGTTGDVGIPILLAFIPIAAFSLFFRYRRATREGRQQLKWLVFSVIALTISFAISDETVIGEAVGARAVIDDIIGVLTVSGIPVAAGIAILRHRLYDIDVVINKTVVYGGLAAFITAVYVAIVVGVGAVIGQGEEPNLGLSIAATAVVAVAFQPVRERVQRFANRLVYGKRATPYEVLSEFSDRVAETYATEDVLPRMARTLAEGTGAAKAEVWLRSGGELRRAAAWPDDDTARESLAMSNGSVPDVPGVDRVIEVRHQGELLGALTVTKPAGEPLTPAEDKLLSDLAGQAGLVLRNVGLTSELLARLEELKASRQRLVAAQDEERRRLERNLHDGAQQHLVALKMKLNLAKRLARENDKLEKMLGQLLGDADEALETLRDLARGIYPPLLADQGLKAALESQVRKASVPVTVEADGLSRYPQEIEAAVYFCVLEALQNVAKYANASQAWVRVMEEEGALVFEVRDDGSGFDPATTPKGAGTTNMSDRLESLGGALAMSSTPGRGTAVSGRLPARVVEPVA